jgi:hypothetical protein
LVVVAVIEPVVEAVVSAGAAAVVAVVSAGAAVVAAASAAGAAAVESVVVVVSVFFEQAETPAIKRVAAATVVRTRSFI